MIQVSFSVTQSDGSDGYAAGTWGARVTCAEPGGIFYDSDNGGWPSRELAVEWARKRAASYCNSAPLLVLEESLADHYATPEGQAPTCPRCAKAQG